MTAKVRLYAIKAEELYQVPRGSVFSRSRRSPVAGARRAVMLWLWEDGYSLAQIGRWLNRDRTTVGYAVGQGLRSGVA